MEPQKFPLATFWSSELLSGGVAPTSCGGRPGVQIQSGGLAWEG